jgi:hypothetical protein
LAAGDALDQKLASRIREFASNEALEQNGIEFANRRRAGGAFANDRGLRHPFRSQP